MKDKLPRGAVESKGKQEPLCRHQHSVWQQRTLARSDATGGAQPNRKGGWPGR